MERLDFVVFVYYQALLYIDEKLAFSSLYYYTKFKSQDSPICDFALNLNTLLPQEPVPPKLTILNEEITFRYIMIT